MRTKAELTWLATKKRAERRRAIGRGIVLGLALGTPAVWFAVWGRQGPDAATTAFAAAEAFPSGYSAPITTAYPAASTSSSTSDRPGAAPPSSDGVAEGLLAALADLKNPIPKRRARAIRHLGDADLGPADTTYFEDLLIGFARGKTADDRLAAIDVIGFRASPRTLVVLPELLTEDDAEVVAAAARAAGNARYFGAREHLLALLENDDALVDVETAVALDLLDDSNGRDRLVAIANERRNFKASMKAFRTLNQRGDHRVQAIAYSYLDADAHPHLLADACWALAELRAPVTEEQVSTLLRSNDPTFRLPGVYARAASGHMPSVQSLLDTAGDPHGDLNFRVLASNLLLKLDSPRFRPKIDGWLTRLDDESYREQMEATLDSQSWVIEWLRVRSQ